MSIVAVLTFDAVTYECTVCLETIDRGTHIVLPCNHIFHCRCVQAVQDGRCPNCRLADALPMTTTASCRRPRRLSPSPPRRRTRIRRPWLP